MSKKIRKKYQVFTPQKTVELMLDSIGYSGPSIVEKTIIDISCGDGAFLKAALRRYIKACLECNLTVSEIELKAPKHIFGFEIEGAFYIKCKKDLSAIMHDVLGSNNVAFYNIKKCDGLEIQKARFDYVVGNPPYVSYKEMSKEKRDYLISNFKTCKEFKFDYSYAFIEKSVDILTKDGVACIISPINMYRIKSGRMIRDYLKDKLYKVIDTTEDNIFPGVLTNPVISFFCLNKKDDLIDYQKKNQKISITLQSFFDGTFAFSEKKHGRKRFGDYYFVKNGVATLLNDAFLVPKDCDIEKEALKDAFSPKSIRYHEDKKIIFPYFFVDGQLNKYSENNYKELFPKAYNHLKKYKSFLEKRNIDVSTQWFEYGRTQALNNVSSEKVLIPSIFSSNIKVAYLKSNSVVYAGFYIITKDPIAAPLSSVEKILKSEELFKYIQRVGVKMSGNTFRYSVQDLENYYF